MIPLYRWIIAMVIGLVSHGAAATSSLSLGEIRLPPGFIISVYTDQVPNARSLALSPAGTVFVGTRQAGKVYAVIGEDRAKRIVLIAEDLDQPNGVAVFRGDLYVAEEGRILRFRDIDRQLSRGARIAAPEIIIDRLPVEGGHTWKFIAFGPDGKLYVPFGAPCNICDPKAPFAGISRLNSDGSALESVARGVRNTVGFDWHPRSRELWFTDNGRDWLGDDQPPDELNRAARPGLHFGYPYCHGSAILDPQFGKGHRCSDFTPPAAELGAHVAALGMRFYTGTQFPSAYRDAIFIAEHGSWNRRRKTGYRIVMVTLNGNQVVGQQIFAEGWLRPNESVWGRPVDLLVMPDGSLLVSDDFAGAIYRIQYQLSDKK